MLLRSSSTPVLGSLLSSFSDSQPEFHGATPKHTPPSIHQSCSKLSHNFSKSLFHSPSIVETKATTTSTGFRRVQSEGNLEELADASYNVDEFGFSKKFARKTNCCTLEAIPSFSINHLGTRYEDDDSDDEEQFEDEELELDEVDNPFTVENLVLEEVRSNVNDYGGLRFEGGEKMYLATGLGFPRINFVDGGVHGGGSGGGGSIGGGGGGSYRPDKDGGDSRGISMEEHYKGMLEGNPGNPLVLRNYAQFLYQKKGDLEGAEEYYSRAILSDPEDGEILSQYAKLIWELHHDKDRAANYFERAVQASSEDSHIHAAYASFLWDMEDDEDEEEETAAENTRVGQPLFHHGLMASATA